MKQYLTFEWFLILSLLMVASCEFSPVDYAAETGEFLAGGDISALGKMEDMGAVYRDNDKPGDAITIMRNHGANCFRLRLFVKPTGEGMVVQDIAYTIALAKRIKAVGAKIMLDFHYSDTWADPGKQHKPNAWIEYSLTELEQAVYEHTRESIAAMKKAGVTPELVQVGNEIDNGMLWPDGRVSHGDNVNNTPKQYDQLARLLKAGIRGVRDGAPGEDVTTIIHAAGGGKWDKIQHYYKSLLERGVEFDMIGLSNYPWWQGNISHQRQVFENLARTFKKPIISVEVAFLHRIQHNRKLTQWLNDGLNEYPISPEGQKRYMEAFVRMVRETPNGLGMGAIWWFPESIPLGDFKNWQSGAAAMFDGQGNALPVLDAFQP
jgi:arabinogalactan endo-1,4-beta-galactosidase